MVGWVGWLLGEHCVACRAPGSSLCRECRWQLRPAGILSPAPPLAHLAALVEYEGRGRDVVAGLKFHNRRGVVAELGRAMAPLVPAPVDAITWVPTTAQRRRARGYDQSRLLARAVGHARAEPVIDLLGRLDRQPQTGRGRHERLEGPSLRARRAVGGTVMLVDDVVTTGTTMRVGAEALLAAGAATVYAVALAHTPDRLRSQSGTARR